MRVEQYQGGSNKDGWYITSNKFEIEELNTEKWAVIDLGSNELLHLSEFFRNRYEESLVSDEDTKPEDIKF